MKFYSYRSNFMGYHKYSYLLPHNLVEAGIHFLLILNKLERALEMLFRGVTDRKAAVRVRTDTIEVTLNQLDKANDEFDGNLLVATLKVIEAPVEDFNKQFNRYRYIHTRISNPESTLQALEDSLAVSDTDNR